MSKGSMNRRQFFQSTAVVGGALGAATAASAQGPEKKYQEKSSPWPVVLNASTIRPCLSKDKIRVAAEAGYDGIELWINDLEELARDPNPRVRLEAIRALSFFHSVDALAAAEQVLLRPMDDYLNYTLGETINTLERRIQAKQPNYSVMAPLAQLVEQNKVPADRLNDIVSMICKRGNSDELAAVFQRTMHALRRLLGQLDAHDATPEGEDRHPLAKVANARVRQCFARGIVDVSEVSQHVLEHRAAAQNASENRQAILQSPFDRHILEDRIGAGGVLNEQLARALVNRWDGDERRERNGRCDQRGQRNEPPAGS